MSECQSDDLTARDWKECGCGLTHLCPPKKGVSDPPDVVVGEPSPKFRYCFDLDGTLCDTEGMDYWNARPRPAMIALVNALYDAGHHVEIRTGRGYTTGLAGEWALASVQLRQWGCRVTKVGQKPSADVIFEDRKSTRLNSSHSAKSRMPSSA